MPVTIEKVPGNSRIRKTKGKKVIEVWAPTQYRAVQAAIELGDPKDEIVNKLWDSG